MIPVCLLTFSIPRTPWTKWNKKPYKHQQQSDGVFTNSHYRPRNCQSCADLLTKWQVFIHRFCRMWLLTYVITSTAVPLEVPPKFWLRWVITSQLCGSDYLLMSYIKLISPGQNGLRFADAFSRCIFVHENVVFWLKFHWSSFLRVQLTIPQHWHR